ncbi:glycosyltransferase, partial [Staphylococcus aureus]
MYEEIKKVVLCVTIHNAATTLAETLDSLLAQDYQLFKIKLFNNASTDETRQVIDEYLLKSTVFEVFD